MNTKYVVLASALLMSLSGNAQKDQLKAAEKAFKSSNVAETQKQLELAEPLMANATDADRAQYYFLKGNLHLQLAKSQVDAGKNYLHALEAYASASDAEKKSGKSKNANMIEVNKLSATAGLKDSAYNDYKNKDYKNAAEKYFFLYQIDKTQQDYLFNASNSALLGKDYDTALKYLKELQDLNYTGAATYYNAYNILKKSVEYFDSQKTRDAAVKAGTHNDPQEEEIKSRAGEIAKNIAYILIEKGQLEDAKAAIAKAKAANPEDVGIILAEANMYLQTNDMATYEKLISEVLKKQPNNHELIFNLGVISYNNKDFGNAEKYYKRVMELKPDYANAYFNLAALKIDVASEMLDKMNKLGTSAADNKKYDAMKKERDGILTEVVGLLEKTISYDKKKMDAKTTLLSVYKALEMTDKAKALKAQIDAEGGN
jgi:tetratricopeptide (TPR) repeat protein